MVVANTTRAKGFDPHPHCGCRFFIMPKPPTAVKFSIDIRELDVEWLEQPKMVGECSKRLAVAKRYLEAARNALELCKARAARAIRQNPKKYELSKVTDETVKEAVIIQKSVWSATEEVTKWRYRVDVLTGALNALEHRKRALENLVDLHGRDYFSAPRARSEAGQTYVSDVKKNAARRRALRSPEDAE